MASISPEAAAALEKIIDPMLYSPSPLPENGSTSPGGDGSEMFSNNNLDDRDGSDPDVESTTIQMSESSSSVGKRKAVVVIRASEEEMKSETSTPPVKKKGKRNMHRCEICSRKFDRYVLFVCLFFFVP